MFACPQLRLLDGLTLRGKVPDDPLKRSRNVLFSFAEPRQIGRLVLNKNPQFDVFQ